MQSGVLISLRNLTKLELAPDGKTVVIGGGLLSHQVVEGLWKEGKRTTTGICGCVSYAGPALGGGHGVLQGQYGLVADQVVSVRVVLADGEVVVASEVVNEDLFWGIRGAGHNFGVVSEFTVRVHDVGRKEWAWELFTFGGERLEEVYKLMNEMMEDQPAEAVVWSVWQKIPEVDPDKVGLDVSWLCEDG
jgi:FAD/FMN-containing dehydrogenase